MQETLKRNIRGIRWVNPALLHITLKFIGETDTAQVAPLGKLLGEVAKNTAPFKVSLTNLGAFPTFQKPRVLWIGTGEGTHALGALARDVEAALKNIHPAFLNGDSPAGNKKSGFTPHLTIGRKNKNMVFTADPLIFDKRWGCRNILYVESFYLMQSILGPAGPRYIPLQEFLLNKMQGRQEFPFV